MRFVADVHLHSRYARATSRDLNPENLHLWSALKGITVVGTGDFTHPAWLAELQEKLEPAEEGLYRLKAPWRQPVEAQIPPSCLAEVRFLLSVEISSIYKKNGRTRKVHNVVVIPGFEQVEALNRRLGAIGNLKSDGRPILGLDSRDLLEICLEVCPEVLFIPAHIWTPHFAALGSASGFDSLEECYEDLLPHIPAVETGLSSDPPMNSRIAELDRFALVSNSDAHSPQNLAREGTCFDTELSYSAMLAALWSRDPAQFTGTLEFYPEEGKYHCDGHRNCQVRWQPAQTLAAAGRCPVCGQQLTVGVLHRVELLADRLEGEGPKRPCEYLIPLTEVIGSALGVGPTSKKVQAVYQQLLANLGPELHILRHATPEVIAATGEELVAEGVRRMRQGQVQIAAGYDGEYGVIQLFTDEERQQLKGQKLLFALPASAPAPQAPAPVTPVPLPNPQEPAAVPASDLDPAQQRAVEMEGGPVVVIAGPGSGKTRTLTQHIAHLIRQRGIEPGQILALTFTRRAAAELRQRLEILLGDTATLAELHVGTGRQPLHLRPAQQGGALLRLLSVPGEKAEGIAVVQEISRMVGGADMVQSDRQTGRGKKTRSLADFGVLFRTHAQALMLEECFLHAGLPYHLLGEKSFLAAPPVRQALSFLRFVLQPEEPLRLLQALELPAFNPGAQALLSLGRQLTRPVAPEILPTARTLCIAAQEYRHLAAQEGPAVLVRRYQQEYGADADLSRLAQLAERAASLEDLLATVALGVGADYERRSANVESVRLLTLHAAKGLEFDVVFLCGMEEGLLPLSGADLEEERRLCYVGLIRAREELVLVAARSRQQYGQRVEPSLSSFVGELPAELLLNEKVEPPRRAEAEQLSLF